MTGITSLSFQITYLKLARSMTSLESLSKAKRDLLDFSAPMEEGGQPLAKLAD